MRARHVGSIALGFGTAVVLLTAMTLLFANGVAGAGVLFVLLFAGSYLARSARGRASGVQQDRQGRRTIHDG